MNDYYLNTTVPAPGTPGSSATMRSEFVRVEQGFEKLPGLAGNGGKFVRVDSGGTRLDHSNLLSESGGALVISGPKPTGAGVDALFAAPPAIGGTTPAAATFTTAYLSDAIPPGDATNRVATTSFVMGIAFGSVASLPGQTGNSGNLLKTRAGAAFWSKGELEPEIVSGTAFSIEHGKHYILTNAAKTTGTAPASPAIGDQFRVTVANGREDNEIAWNGNKHENLSDATMVINMAGASFVATYVSAGFGYKVAA